MVWRVWGFKAILRMSMMLTILMIFMFFVRCSVGKKFQLSLVAAAVTGRREHGVRGSSKTNMQIQQQAGRLALAIEAAGYGNLQTASQLREKHIRAAFQFLLATHTLRTCQNYSRTLRYVLHGVGKSDLLKALTNQELGIGGASRNGTKTAMPDHRFTEFVELAKNLNTRDHWRREALPLILVVARLTGMRIQEVRMCADQATRHTQTLQRDGTLELRDGTKGGRFRVIRIRPQRHAELLDAFKQVIEIAARHGGKLWPREKGKSAQASLSRELRKIGMVGQLSAHSLRYAFTQEQARWYRSEGYSTREILRQAALDLGHGDSRVNYVSQVYYR